MAEVIRGLSEWTGSCGQAEITGSHSIVSTRKMLGQPWMAQGGCGQILKTMPVYTCTGPTITAELYNFFVILISQPLHIHVHGSGDMNTA